MTIQDHIAALSNTAATAAVESLMSLGHVDLAYDLMAAQRYHAAAWAAWSRDIPADDNSATADQQMAWADVKAASDRNNALRAKVRKIQDDLMDQVGAPDPFAELFGG